MEQQNCRPAATGALTRRSWLRRVPAWALAAGGSAHAQATPAATSRMATMLVAYPAGGPADVTARQIEPAMRRFLGQGLVVENVPGASGGIAVGPLLQAPHDGQTVLFADASNVILAPLALAAVRHKPEQLRLVGLASRTPLLLLTGNHAGAPGMDELLASARKPGAQPISYGSFGAGSVPHLAAEDLSARLRLPLMHVPYRGAAPLVQDLIGGQVQLAFLPVGGNTVDLVQQKRLRPLAVTAEQRLTRLPGVLTMTEATGLSDTLFEMWGGLFVARDVSLETATRLNKAVDEGLQDPEFRRQLELAGATVGPRWGLPELERFYAAETHRYGRIAAAMKLQPQ